MLLRSRPNIPLAAFVILLVAAALGFVASGAIAQRSSAMALPNCIGKPEVKPNEVVIACADGGVVAQHLRWTGWGQSFAAALGTMSVNDCKPYCAAGHFHRYRIILVATGMQNCPNGAPAYRSVTFAYIGKGPNTGSTMDYACGPRR